MKWRKLLYLLVIALLAVALAACSNTEDDSGNDESKDTEDNEDTSDKKYSITAMDFSVKGVEKDGPGLQMINEKFNVDYQVDKVLKDGYDEKLSAVFSSGDIPDVVGFKGGDTKYNKFAKQGAFLPLNEYIDEYPSLKAVPQAFWDSLKVDGKIYGIPAYTSRFPGSTIIRKDWLDNLGLEVPTNVEELKEVAIAFSEEDPDGNGKDDTYGLLTTVGNNIFPFYAQGPYWDPEVFYGAKNEKGQLVPNRVGGDGWKKMIQSFRDLYDVGALHPDFHVMSVNQGNKEFYGGETGMWTMSIWTGFDDFAKTLQKKVPEAEIVPVPAFEDPKGNTGWKMNRGYKSVTTLSADLADNPGKIKRILKMVDEGRTWIPRSERTPDNGLYDWLNGKEGQGYKMVDGEPEDVKDATVNGLTPQAYLPDSNGYPPKGESADLWKDFDTEVLQKAVKAKEKMHLEQDAYFMKKLLVQSDTQDEIGKDLRQFLIDERVKMIVGEKPMSDWDEVIDEWYDRGGAKVIEEYNKAFEEMEDFEPWVRN